MLAASRRKLFSDKEIPTVHLVGDGKEFPEDFYEDIARRVWLCFLVVGEHFRAAVEQEYAKQRQHPFETRHHGCSKEDEETAQHQCSDDAPEEHLVLILSLYAEEREEHEEHKQVIHRQRFLDEVAREELQGLLFRFDGVEKVDADAEQQRNSYPHARHAQRLTNAHFVLPFSPEGFQVDGQHKQHQCVE